MSFRDKILYLATGALLSLLCIGAGLLYISRDKVMFKVNQAVVDIKRDMKAKRSGKKDAGPLAPIEGSSLDDLERNCSTRWKSNTRMRDYCIQLGMEGRR